MTRYLISFPDGAMSVSQEDRPKVSRAAHAVVAEAQAAGVWVFGVGVEAQDAIVVGTDGSLTDLPYPTGEKEIGGFSIVDVPSRQEALMWAAKIATACRCPQEVRALMPDDAV